MRISRNRTCSWTLHFRCRLVSLNSSRNTYRCIFRMLNLFFSLSVGVSWSLDQASWEQTSKCHMFNRRILLVSFYAKQRQFMESSLHCFLQLKSVARMSMFIKISLHIKPQNLQATATSALVLSLASQTLSADFALVFLDHLRFFSTLRLHPDLSACWLSWSSEVCSDLWDSSLESFSKLMQDGQHNERTIAC